MTRAHACVCFQCGPCVGQRSKVMTFSYHSVTHTVMKTRSVTWQLCIHHHHHHLLRARVTPEEPYRRVEMRLWSSFFHFPLNEHHSVMMKELWCKQSNHSGVVVYELVKLWCIDTIMKHQNEKRWGKTFSTPAWINPEFHLQCVAEPQRSEPSISADISVRSSVLTGIKSKLIGRGCSLVAWWN